MATNTPPTPPLPPAPLRQEDVLRWCQELVNALSMWMQLSWGDIRQTTEAADYTGTGGGSQQIEHALGRTPAFILISGESAVGDDVPNAIWCGANTPQIRSVTDTTFVVVGAGPNDWGMNQGGVGYRYVVFG